MSRCLAKFKAGQDFPVFGNAAICEEPCVINLLQELSLELIQHRDLVIQREDVVGLLQESGRKVVSHPGSWAPKLGINIEETISNSFVLVYFRSQSTYE